MDIQYLLFLQALREAAPAWISAFLSFMSEFTVSPVCIIIPSLLFWCVDKRAGNYLFFTINGSTTVNDAVKITACVYRPWIRDSRVNSTLRATATGYSFPSGHTTTGVALYGGIGVLLKKYGTWAMLLCFIPAVLTGFARNWVGAHTPQDVVIGFLCSLLILFLMAKLLTWLDENPDKDKRIMIIGLAACLALLVYVTVKPYPMDYAADGTLIVDPKEMMTDCFKSVGRMTGFLLGWYIERRMIRFETNVSLRCRILRGICGVATALPIYMFVGKLFVRLLGNNIGGCAKGILIMAYITAIYPFLFTTVEEKCPAWR